MKNSKVSFIELTQAEYDNSLKHSENAFYWCTDTKKLYKGDNMIGNDASNKFIVIPCTISGHDITSTVKFDDIVASAMSGNTICFNVSFVESGTSVSIYYYYVLVDTYSGGKVFGRNGTLQSVTITDDGYVKFEY